MGGNVIFVPENVIFVPGNVIFVPGNVIFVPGNVIFVPENVIFGPENVIFVSENVIFVPEHGRCRRKWETVCEVAPKMGDTCKGETLTLSCKMCVASKMGDRGAGNG